MALKLGEKYTILQTFHETQFEVLIKKIIKFGQICIHAFYSTKFAYKFYKFLVIIINIKK